VFPDSVTQGVQMAPMVAALQALTGQGGALREVARFLTDGAPWLRDFECDDADEAADHLTRAADSIRDALADLAGALSLVRPLAD
jgi:hypothetical protein